MSVKEVRNPASESESSDVEARSVGDATPPSTPGTSRTERKSIGRSASVTSSGPFVATPEWVSNRIFNLKMLILSNDYLAFLLELVQGI